MEQRFFNKPRLAAREVLAWDGPWQIGSRGAPHYEHATRRSDLTASTRHRRELPWIKASGLLSLLQTTADSLAIVGLSRITGIGCRLLRRGVSGLVAAYAYCGIAVAILSPVSRRIGPPQSAKSHGRRAGLDERNGRAVS
jgi:hypothetical protein